MPHLSAHLQDLLTHKRVLLLQGKMGSFFSRFATFLKKHDISVTKVNFNAGDAYFYKHQPVYNFTGQQHRLADWLNEIIEEHQIDAVVCFGDCRPHHLVARTVLKEKLIPLYVFEEGYLRPSYITLEKHGTNGFSQLNFNDAETEQNNLINTDNDVPSKIQNSFAYMTCIIILYYAVCWLGRHRFPHYRHYRNMNIWQEAGSWLRAPYYRLFEKRRDSKLQAKLTDKLSQQYFLVTLQVHNDFQITQHSEYHDVIEFIDDTIKSFAEHANASHHLVLKHHPMDRGHRHYGKLVKQLTHKYNLNGRVHYGCDMHLPTVIKHSIGMVTINSTTGLQSLYHKKPVIVLSDAVYNQPGLTAQSTLDEFWTHQAPVNYENYLKFRNLLLATCQLNGSFYSGNPWMEKTYNLKNLTPTEQKKEENNALSKHTRFENDVSLTNVSDSMKNKTFLSTSSQNHNKPAA